MRWRRFRKWAKWACTLAAGVTVALAAFTALWYIDYGACSSDGDALVIIDIGGGFFGWMRTSGIGRFPSAGRSWVRLLPSRVWYFGFHDEMARAQLGDGWHAGFFRAQDPNHSIFGVSLIYPILFTAAPAALLWYADRRRFGPGRCAKCGYDRRGLAADAKCPECGTTSVPATR